MSYARIIARKMSNEVNLAPKLAAILLLTSAPAMAQSGYQIIEGTKVFTEVFVSEGYARFSNECGSQTISQRDLQAGAIPRNIIPCNRSARRDEEVEREIQRLHARDAKKEADRERKNAQEYYERFSKNLLEDFELGDFSSAAGVVARIYNDLEGGDSKFLNSKQSSWLKSMLSTVVCYINFFDNAVFNKEELNQQLSSCTNQVFKEALRGYYATLLEQAPRVYDVKNLRKPSYFCQNKGEPLSSACKIETTKMWRENYNHGPNNINFETIDGKNIIIPTGHYLYLGRDNNLTVHKFDENDRGKVTPWETPTNCRSYTSIARGPIIPSCEFERQKSYFDQINRAKAKNSVTASNSSSDGKLSPSMGYSQKGAFDDCASVYAAAGLERQAEICRQSSKNMRTYSE